MVSNQKYNTLVTDYQLRGKAETYLQIINQFAVNISALNTIHYIVWEIAKFAIAGIGFVDCVVYLKDEQAQQLIQVASHGPKNPADYEIKDPIAIKIGQGIVGSVAQTGIAERINDTLHDPRYILDDEFRRSELAVPIIHEEIVLGVIDSEHPEPAFYTKEHEGILNTIASLVAPRIAYIQATQSEIAESQQQLLNRTKELKAALESLKSTQEELVKAKEEAEAASHAKSAFISQMSHELRSPLTSILGYSQLLQRYGADDPKVLKAASIINTGGNHLLTLINDILAFSKLESAAYTIHSEFIAVKPFLNDISQLVRVQAKEKGLEFKLVTPTPLPLTIFVDPNRLRQVLMNLIINGIKFTEVGTVTLAVTSGEPSQDGITQLHFSVADSGIGIAKENFSKIFLPFEQVHLNTDQTKGTGLGLAIAQQIVMSMNGTITVASELGKGSQFSFTIDVPYGNGQTETTSQQHDRKIVGYEGNTRTVLIAEDLIPIRTFLSHALSMLGFDTVEAENGTEAIKSLQVHQPDLILMDTLMPQMDGITATQKIRQTAGYEQLPIIAISAHVLPDDIEQILENGADRFMAKPIIMNELIPILQELLCLEWIYQHA